MMHEAVISNRGRIIHISPVPFLLASSVRGYVKTVCGKTIVTAIRLTAPEVRALERDGEDVRRCERCFTEAYPTNMSEEDR